MIVVVGTAENEPGAATVQELSSKEVEDHSPSALSEYFHEEEVLRASEAVS